MKTLILLFSLILLPAMAQAATDKVTFAMGCFWCAEHDFENIDGVTDVVSGYEGGTKETANYDAVSSGETGHVEAVEVTYDPEKVSYEKLLTVFFDNIDLFDQDGQFCDQGTQYAAVIFTKTGAEKAAAEKMFNSIQSRHEDRPLAVRILPAKPFFPAEAYHQDFAENNAVRYKMYRSGCGRDTKLQELRGQ